MTVAIMINDDKSDHFYVCVSTESSYEKYWCPAIAALGLYWAPYFQGGCVLEQEDWPQIKTELLLIEEWIRTNLCEHDNDLNQWFGQRFEDIISQVEEHFKSDGRRLWIG